MFSPTVKFIAIGVIKLTVEKDENDAEQSDHSKMCCFVESFIPKAVFNLHNRDHVFVFEIYITKRKWLC